MRFSKFSAMHLEAVYHYKFWKESKIFSSCLLLWQSYIENLFAFCYYC